MSQRDPGRTSSRIRKEADELETLLDGVGETAPQPSTRYVSELDPNDERETVVAVMSGVDRKGAWEPAAKISAFAFWGGVKLDFRDAALLEGETVVDCVAIMGGIEIIVPPDIEVETRGFGFMGGFSHVSQRVRGEEVPKLTIKGIAVMGGVDIKIK